MLADKKRQSGYLISLNRVLTPDECKHVIDRYNTVSSMCIKIPESKFNKLKRKHKVKVEISTRLDEYPGSSILLLRLRIWIRDNLRCKEKRNGEN